MMPEDLKELLRAFNDQAVKFLVVGGYAFGVHAEPRHPVHILLVAVVMVARHAAISAIRRDIIRPFVGDTAFHLRR